MIRILLILNFVLICSTEHFIQFESHLNASTKLVNVLVRNDLTLDSSGNDQILVKIVNTEAQVRRPNLVFHCNIKALSSEFYIDKALFCKKETIYSKDKCISVEDKVEMERSPFQITSYDKHTGFSVLLNLTRNSLMSRNENLDGYYFCKISTVLFSLKSKYIEIRDYDGYRRELRVAATPDRPSLVVDIEDIHSNKVPIYLHCNHNNKSVIRQLPSWVANSMPNPFKWHLCLSPLNGTDCVQSLPANKEVTFDEMFSYHQFLNGTVILLDVNLKNERKFGIVCTSDFDSGVPYSVYMRKKGVEESPISIKWGKRYSHFLALDDSFTTSKTYTFREGENMETPYVISIPYVRNNFVEWMYSWSTTGEPFSFDSEFTAYKHSFRSLMNSTVPMSIFLHISSGYHGNSTKKITIKPVRPPTFQADPNVARVINSMKDLPKTIFVKYDPRESEINLEINGQLIDLRSETSRLETENLLFTKFPRLKGLKFDYKIQNMSFNESAFYYTVSFVDPSKRSQESQSHSVSFVNSNDIGASRINYQINIMELPQVLKGLSDYNCKPFCSTTDTHLFKCKINAEYFKNYDLDVQYAWKINGIDVESMNSVFKKSDFMTCKGDSLIIKAIKSNNPQIDKKFNEVLSKANIACDVVLTEIITTKGGSKHFKCIYDSKDYEAVSQALKVSVKFDSQNLPRSVLIYVIPALGVFVIEVLIVTVILHFKMKFTSETYAIERLEEAQGYDRSAEVMDNEMFGCYTKGDFELVKVDSNQPSTSFSNNLESLDSDHDRK